MASYGHTTVVGSLPSDYATVSRFAAAHPGNMESEVESEPSHTSIARRPSRPTMALPTISQHSETLRNPTENTPLLRAEPQVPRIHEPVGDANDAEVSTTSLYWSELRILTKYSLPVFGTHLLEYSLVMAPVLSIGHLSTTALAGITLGSMTASVSGFSILQGMVSALDTMLPSAWTSSQPQLVGLWSQRMAVVMGASLIPMYFIWWNAEAILLALKQDPEVAYLAALYLRWVSLGLPGASFELLSKLKLTCSEAYALNLISRRYFQSQGLFAVPTRIICIVAPINALLNYLLVWGPLPIRLGFIGAPIATVCSLNLVCVMNITYGIFIAPHTAWMPISRRSFTSLGILVNLGLAGVAMTASEWWSWELVALAASMLGPISLAAQSILLSSASTTYQAPFALSVASSVRIGNLLGELNSSRAKIAAHVSLLMALGIALIFSTMFMVFRNSWAYLFNDDPEVVALVASILPLVALFQVFDGTSGVAGGILRAKGKQMTGALLNLSAYYILGIPLGAALAFNAGMGLHGLWIGLTFSLVYCAVFGSLLCLRTDWDREVRKVVARIENETRHKPRDNAGNV
ncbi:RNA helicase [Mycena indigotica]|uniref:RNA helicase n=1 Tax=Mycena indigotica TaxID=2126181 RepID=A0A8H6VU10_9AGAR|nr:RNA helicase [Mycena indigotica]KAF7291886.1 RNA helicase [Mycena indigotica]